MAEQLTTIHAKKYINNNLEDVYYIGTYRPDGWTYFNDDMFYRYQVDNDILQICYMDKQIWVNTNCMIIVQTAAFNVKLAGQLAAGMGVAAANTGVEAAVQWAINKVSNEWLAYTNDPVGRNLNNPNGSAYDCSSFVITAFNQAGFNTGTASYTGDMISNFQAIGFDYILGTYWDSSELLRGDIQIWNIPVYPYGHTNIYIGNNQDVDAGFEPASIVQHTPDNWGRGWDGILRYVG